MTTKTLSTSTLSLKFMQNAHRAKNLAEVQLDKADVKDDGEWEVAKEIRDAWGAETTQSVSYEASYIPFLFTSKEGESDADAATSTSLKGRRTFRRGREVAGEAEATAAPTTSITEAKPSTSKPHGKARQISSLSGRTGGADSKKSSKGASSTKSARQAIYDNSGVGADLRTQRKGGVKVESDDDSRTETKNVPPPNVFLKPAGVDEPAESSKSSLASREAQNPSPDQPHSKGSKRDRDETAAAAASVEGEKKRKKKKKTAVDE
ncbi:hypothetical protein R3P38DRAFT_3077395 [Favolaschia claudopus]|uniref:Uncharacterized protein n=1 Tax=Favolaschia claudopus TaxID=2862362 RepID=A0AAV9ZVV5_9AGAR